jgi:phage gp46-like protein
MTPLDALQTHTLEDESTLKEEIAISLFTNLREVGLNQEHGWWGHALSDPPPFGSKLWRILREKQTQETLEKATLFAEESLQWILDENLAQELNIESRFIPQGIELSIQILFHNLPYQHIQFEVT